MAEAKPTDVMQGFRSGSDSNMSSEDSTKDKVHTSPEHQQLPSKQPNWWVKAWRKSAQAVGFHKTYNLPLFIIFAGAMFGFGLARTYYLDVPGRYSQEALPGEWYVMREGVYRVGITMHLASVIPAALLVVFQFVPWIRYKFILIHRINGYIVSILLLVAVASALMIARKAAGGTVTTQTLFGLLAVLVTGAFGMAYYNVKRLQIEQHRAWMLRTWFYAGAIITLRLIMIIQANIVGFNWGGPYYRSWSCDELNFVAGTAQARRLFPDCFSNATAPVSGERYISVPASFSGNNVAQVGSSLLLSFGAAGWLALFLHVVGVEIYLMLTPAEAQRLRVVSWRKQMEAGMSNPGSAGTVVERFGDAPKWCPPEDVEK